MNISESLQAKCKSTGIEFRLSNIIYRLVEAMKQDIGKKLPPKDQEEILGEANVLAHFKITEGKKKISVAGSRCTKGLLKRDAIFRLQRGDEILFEGMFFYNFLYGNNSLLQYELTLPIYHTHINFLG